LRAIINYNNKKNKLVKMAEKKKSIIEEALLEAKSLEDALKANTKEILASTMKEEIESVVRESLEEQEEIEDNEELEGLDDEMTDDLELPAGEAGEDSEELELDLDAEAGEEEGEQPEAELDLDLDAEEGGDELELPMGDLEGDELGMELGDEEGMLDMGDLEGDELDLTMASDEEVLKVFKSMGDSDEVEVVKDADGISLKDNTTGAEYYIKESEEELQEEGLCEGCGDMAEGDLEETLYEVELDEDMYEAYMESKEMEEGDDVVAETDEEEEDEVIESTRRTRSDRRNRSHKPSNYPTNESRSRRKPLIRESRENRKPRRVTESRDNVRKESYEKLLKEYKELKTKNGEYKEALKVFKTKINEVALFNQNLAHVTKLFTEHSTTKKEKMAILGRFDNVETIKESKSLYKTIEAEMMEKTPITESVEKKVNKTIDSSKSNLNESTAYVDPQINAIKDLMKRIS
jgi:hypothetical protein